jgi:ABC-type Fe3+-hydroxamate transport system substrate-binding protein
MWWSWFPRRHRRPVDPRRRRRFSPAQPGARPAATRTDLESALAARPEIVVRYWGGDPKLLAALSRRGARVVTIGEANDFPAVRRNIAQVSSALGQPARARP